MINIQLPNNWTARKDQLPLLKYLWSGGKRAVVVAHRRWGKDDCALHFTATAAMERIGNYWHMLPKYEQARKAIWTSVNPRTGMKRIDEAFPLEIRKKTLDHEMKIEFINGSTWQLVGSDNYDQYVGSNPIGITDSEYSISNPMAIAYIMPILEENGGWILFIYTARGNNHGKTMYLKAKTDDDWLSMLVTADDSPVFSKAQLKSIKQEYIQLFGPELGEALFLQEYYCSFEGAQLGAYFSKQLAIARREDRITKVPYDTRFKVYLFFDLGVDDSTTIWFIQPIGPRFHVIDYYESMGEGMGHYAKVVKEKPYIYGDGYMPHDGDHRKLGETAETPKEIFERLTGINIEIVARPNDTMAVLRGIQAARDVISRCYFDEKACQQGIFALESYKAEYDSDKKKLSNAPKHDWASHGADAFRTFAVGYVPPVKVKSVTDMLGWG
ncbi:MAG: hypothetical protein GY928_20570 [Colwellia sp.]|nr:hypothetical protein [Colwellia sp.]